MAKRPLPSLRWICVGFVWLPRWIERLSFGKLLDVPSLCMRKRLPMKILSYSATDIVGKLFAPVAREFPTLARVIQLALEADDGAQQLQIVPNGTGGWNIHRATVTAPTDPVISGANYISTELPAGASKAYHFGVHVSSDVGPYTNAEADSILTTSPQSLENFLTSLLAGTYDGATGFDASYIAAVTIDQSAGMIYTEVDAADLSAFITQGDEILEVGETGDLWE